MTKIVLLLGTLLLSQEVSVLFSFRVNQNDQLPKKRSVTGQAGHVMKRRGE
jgi:hypothetical protein